MGAMMMRKEPASAPRRPFEKPTGRRRKPGPSAWNATGALRSPARRSINA